MDEPFTAPQVQPQEKLKMTTIPPIVLSLREMAEAMGLIGPNCTCNFCVASWQKKSGQASPTAAPPAPESNAKPVDENAGSQASLDRQHKEYMEFAVARTATKLLMRVLREGTKMPQAALRLAAKESRVLALTLHGEQDPQATSPTHPGPVAGGGS